MTSDNLLDSSASAHSAALRALLASAVRWAEEQPPSRPWPSWYPPAKELLRQINNTPEKGK